MEKDTDALLVVVNHSGRDRPPPSSRRTDHRHAAHLHSHVSPVRRLAAGLSVVAATAASTVLTATPAHAQTSVTAVVLAFDELRITGTESSDAIEVSGVGPFFVSNSKGPVQAENGCVPDGSRVRCDRVKSIQVSARGGGDSVRTPTSLPSRLFGGGSNDTLAGGFGNDLVQGNRGVDVVNGRSGFDDCSGEDELNCEK